jgi:adenine deaminase
MTDNPSLPLTPTLAERLAVARGDRPADCVFDDAQLVNVLSGEVHPASVAVLGDTIVGITTPGQPGYDAHERISLGGRYLAPGFIDAHVHIESSLCTPPEFARAVLPRGVTSVITDPHEIANVLGLDGIAYMLERGGQSAITMYANASSCVPATAMETSGAALEAADLAALIGHPRITGLAEMMNYPGVIGGDPAVLAKLEAFAALPRDGHAPAVTGKALNAYVASGIVSDHECTTVEEAREKLRLGLHILIREGTTTRNLRALLPLVSMANHARFAFCTDDRQPADLLDHGSIDMMIRIAIETGLDPITAIRLGTINTANLYRLPDRGAIAPGRKADMVVFSDLNAPRAERVFVNGVLVAEGGAMRTARVPLPARPVRPSLHVADPAALDFSIAAPADAETPAHIISAIRDQIVTGHVCEPASVRAGQAVADPTRDLLKIAVIERHTGSGRVGVGFIRGFGLQQGAIAGSVAHDHHNLIVIGADDASMRAAVAAVVALGGGLAVADAAAPEPVLATLALPVAGLMSEAPIETVRAEYDRLLAAARGLGASIDDPFMTMSFMALEVIPALKLTDLGLIDVERFAPIALFGR